MRPATVPERLPSVRWVLRGEGWVEGVRGDIHPTRAYWRDPLGERGWYPEEKAVELCAARERDRGVAFVLSLGAGVQSTTIALLCAEGLFPLTATVFADTGEESPESYGVVWWLAQTLSTPLYIARRGEGRLGDEAVLTPPRRGRTTLPVFVRTAGGRGVGMVRRGCTGTYKIVPITRTIRERVLGATKRKGPVRGWRRVIQYIGISADEAARAVRVRAFIAAGRKGAKAGWAVRFPLLELGWTRGDCVRYLASRVPAGVRVGKSACLFCPFKSNAGWAALKRDNPEGWARAVAVDAGLRSGMGVRSGDGGDGAYLHRSLRPLEEVDFTAQDYALEFATECMGGCGT